MNITGVKKECVSMANLVVVLPKFVFLFLFTFLLCDIPKPTTNSVALALSRKRISTRLIHYNSLVPNPTVSDEAALAMRSSARHAHLKAKANGVSVPDEDIRAGILPGSGNLFFVNFTIGTPPIPQLAIMDTGSSLFWVQCQPCKSCKQTPNPIYDPTKSSSYGTSACDQAYCSKTISGKCVEYRECAYEIKYSGGTSSAGVIALESVAFETSYEEGQVVVPFVVFGCGWDNHEALPVPQSSGVFGLSADDSSIIRSSTFKNSPRFSYCLGNVSDPTYTYSMLFLGNDSILDGQESPLVIRNGVFFVSLEGIKVGETELYMKKDEYKFNVLVDTGSTFSFFHSSTCDALKREIQKTLDPSFQRVSMEGYPDLLCYQGDFRRDLLDFPTVTFRLANETLIELDMEGILYQLKANVFCLAVAPDDNLPIIGMLAQQYYNFGIDIDANKLYVQSMDCRFIDS